MHDAAGLGRHILMALVLSAHGKGSIHVHVMTGQVQTDQTLEDHAVCRLGCCQEDEQAGCGAAIGNHIQDGTESSALLKSASSNTIKRVEKA